MKYCQPHAPFPQNSIGGSRKRCILTKNSFVLLFQKSKSNSSMILIRKYRKEFSRFDLYRSNSISLSFKCHVFLTLHKILSLQNDTNLLWKFYSRITSSTNGTPFSIIASAYIQTISLLIFKQGHGKSKKLCIGASYMHKKPAITLNKL